jgi:ADP-heptose:LPS heptosyltransferase
MKILAIQFRYLGDAVLMTPALRAIRDHFPGVRLHVIVAEEVVPLLRHVPWIERVWPYPRRRGSKAIAQVWPVLRALRCEGFDRSVDFGGNDRGALTSILCGARQRLGPLSSGGFLGRRWCYTETVSTGRGHHEAVLNLRILAPWGITPPDAPRLEIHPDPDRAGDARRILPRDAILCHLSTSQPKKEWPLARWAELHRIATAAGLEVAFSTGVTARESSLLEELKALAPGAHVLPVVPDLSTFLAVLSRSRLFIGSDTGPLPPNSNRRRIEAPGLASPRASSARRRRTRVVLRGHFRARLVRPRRSDRGFDVTAALMSAPQGSNEMGAQLSTPLRWALTAPTWRLNHVGCPQRLGFDEPPFAPGSLLRPPTTSARGERTSAAATEDGVGEGALGRPTEKRSAVRLSPREMRWPHVSGRCRFGFECGAGRTGQRSSGSDPGHWTISGSDPYMRQGRAK